MLYVYTHDDTDGEVAYVGHGRDQRCLDRHNRTKEHSCYMERRFAESGLGFISIILKTDSVEEARQLELSLIRDLCPRFNRMGVSAANAGRGHDNHNSVFSPDQVAFLRSQWKKWEGSMRSFYREYSPDVAWTTLRKLLLGESYCE